MPDYKLTYNSTTARRIDDNTFIPANPGNRDWIEYQMWLGEGNTPLPADEPPQSQLDREEEIRNAPGTAKQWFGSKPAAIAFMRKTPVEQELKIEAMTNTQLKELVKYLTIAVSALVRERYL